MIIYQDLCRIIFRKVMSACLYLEKISINSKASTNAATITAAVKARSSAAFWVLDVFFLVFLGFLGFDILKKGIGENNIRTKLLNFPEHSHKIKNASRDFDPLEAFFLHEKTLYLCKNCGICKPKHSFIL
jgi:hypothetical protein